MYLWCGFVRRSLGAVQYWTSSQRLLEGVRRVALGFIQSTEKSTELKAIEGINRSRLWGRKLQWFSKRVMVGLRDRLRSPPRLSKLHKHINKTLMITYKCFTEEGAIYNVNLKRVYDHVDW